MGSGYTGLRLLPPPPPPPDCITYNSCILSSRPYRPAVAHCYKYFLRGHLRSSCPYPSDSTMESSVTATYKCDLCKTNDHEITAKTDSTKQRAAADRRRRQRQAALAANQSTPSAGIPTHNRFTLLEEEGASVDDPSSGVPLSCSLPYSTVVRQRR
ncbi:unnamed protein product [Ixodes persulcatus]